MFTTKQIENHLATLQELRSMLRMNTTRIAPVTLDPQFAYCVLEALDGLDLEDFLEEESTTMKINRAELREAIESAVSDYAMQIADDVFHEINAGKRRTA